jgi:alkylation response protein AidB-like acyl-CoA dehydrogenase
MVRPIILLFIHSLSTMINDLNQLPAAGNKYASKLRFRHCAQEQQILKYAVPTEFGGLGNSFHDLVEAHQALGKLTQDTGLILSLNAHLWGSVFPLLIYGTPAQRQEWLPDLLSGDLIAGHAITEAQAGSDVNALATIATQTKDGFVLNGCKRFITNTPIADMLLIYAVLDGALSAFLVKKQDIGANFAESPRVDGCITATMGDVILQGCLIPKDRQLGKTGAGKMMLQTALELERAFIFAGLSGVMGSHLTTVINYSRERQVGGAHLGSYQAISHKIAEMKVQLDTIRLWVNECARLKDHHKRITLASAQTKLFASEAFLQFCLDAVQILGARGMIEGNSTLALVNDALASRLFSGSSEIQKNIIAALLGTGEGFKFAGATHSQL